jgi:hypothetical protein
MRAGGPLKQREVVDPHFYGLDEIGVIETMERTVRASRECEESQGGPIANENFK